MGVDLKLTYWMGGKRLFFDQEALIQLEPELVNDRLRRILYEEVASVCVSREPPWMTLLIMGVLVGLPGLLALFFLQIVGFILLGFAIVIILAHFSSRKTVLRIHHLGGIEELSGIAGRRKVDRFILELRRRINKAQAEARARLEATASSSPVQASPLQASPVQPPPFNPPPASP